MSETESHEPPTRRSQPHTTERPAQSSSGLAERFMYKNRLQEYTQKSAIPLPKYQNINEGAPHAPKFRATVLVDGVCYTSPYTFAHRKAAEQDVARVALLGISQKIKNEGCPLVREDTVFCKSILNEYAVKMNLERPTYETIQPEGLLPVFVSSLVFNGVTYTGDTGRNKKEAEQLAARAVILSILDSDSGTFISEIIKSKYKLYAALHKVKDSSGTYNGILPMGVITGTSLGIPLSKRKDVEVSGVTGNMPITAISEPCVGEPPNISATHPPLHEFKKPKLEPSPEVITPPIVFVPPILKQPLVVGSTSGGKRNRKNKKKTKKNEQVDAQLPVAVLPLTQLPPQLPPCSVAQ